MKPISPAFLRSLSGSHKMLARARVCGMFQTGTNPIGTFLSIIDGSVSASAPDSMSSAVRATLDITVNGIRQWPIARTSLLAPYGNELYVERGIEFSDDTVEYTKLGYFRIQSPEQTGISDSPIRMICVDRMQSLIDGKLLTPRQFVIGTTYGAIVANLVTEIYPTAVIEWDDLAYTQALTRSVIVDSDRFGTINDLVSSLGKIWFWDYRGVLVIKTPPAATNVVYTVNHGKNGVLATFARVLTREGVFNAVVASGEGVDTNVPVRGVAIDNDVNSPTYFYGQFGQVPTFFTSPLLATNAQCVTAAKTLLNSQLGLPYTINFGTIVNPALEPFDAVLVKYSHNEPQQVHVLDTVTVPLMQSGLVESKTRVQHLVLASSA